ncbi:MAG: hypothetical protein HY462_01505 [Parcubacteria group bacterium]|nr:hypothetical protein [Parcubacteria group bacterium]
MFPAIETSQDVLFYALAAAAIGIAFFLCWSLYYLVMTLRDTRMMTHDIRKRLAAFWEVVELVREKLQLGGAVMKLAATGIRELAEYVRQYTEGEKPKRSKKKGEK